MYNPFSLVGKTVLITGASSGIGRATAIECAKMGANVIITGRNTERLNDTFKALYPSEAHMQFVLDLTNDGHVIDTIPKLPPVDGIVHSAGVMRILPFGFVNRAKLEDLMDINFMAPVALTQALLKHKKITNSASIVFVSSTSGVINSAVANSMYSATKGAINGIAKGMAIDLASKKIRVNCVNPGMVETPLYDNSSISLEQLEEDKKKYLLGRYGKPEEVAYAIIYLLSDASKWTTGTNLLLDGGYTLL
ncbi:SDR family oxidoreductase [Bacteroides sp.]|uniref:SDR family NAD(P)-dependent oxidoreductase n=1 Tax=Bacteroides sp. TaxID=29523 RepID=UPI002FC7A971